MHDKEESNTYIKAPLLYNFETEVIMFNSKYAKNCNFTYLIKIYSNKN